MEGNTFKGEKALKFLAKAALKVGVKSTSSACVLFYHQPKVPQGMSKFQKEKK
jgi:cyclic lactone autoinducer peptide